MKPAVIVLLTSLTLIVFRTIEGSAQELSATEQSRRNAPGEPQSGDLAAGDTVLTRERAKELVATVIPRFYEDIVDVDRPTRVRALKSIQPTEKAVACLFGKQNESIGFAVLRPRIDAMMAHVDEVIAQLKRDGRFFSVELSELSVPTRIEERALGDLMQSVCPETFRFKASILTEQAQSSTGSYFVIDRKVVLIRDGDLIKIARRINANR